MADVKVLIDADSIIYRAGFAAERSKYLVESSTEGLEPMNRAYSPFDDAKTAKQAAAQAVGSIVWSRKELEPVENANLMLDLFLKGILEACNATKSQCVLYLTPSVGNFRDGIAMRAKYKGNRDTQARPTHFKALQRRIIEVHGAVFAEGEEADDAIGVAISTDKQATMVHIDKDLDQLPGYHYNWVDKTSYEVTPQQGVTYHYQQTLSGDAGDNIPGIDGVGPVGAAKILDGAKTPAECWKRVLEAYTKTYSVDGPAFALEAARLTHIRRKAGQIWQPPK